jgi:hypothetical protein
VYYLKSQIKAIFKGNTAQIAGKYDACYISMDYHRNLILLSILNKGKSKVHTIFHSTENRVNKVSISPVQDSFLFAQPLGDNWLLVNDRVENDTTHNAFLYHEQDGMIRSFPMGDGIEDVQTTEKGDIWVSYFDEGVFGDTMGESGLLCFDKNGNQIFDFAKFTESPITKEIPFIDDCYALNVCSDETLYLYYYSDFPVVALHNKTNFELFQDKAFHTSPIRGSHAFAVWEDYILFGHGYKGKGKLYLFSKIDRKVQTYIPVDEENRVIPHDYAIGRAHKLLLVCKNDIYEVDMRDVVV